MICIYIVSIITIFRTVYNHINTVPKNMPVTPENKVTLTLGNP